MLVIWKCRHWMCNLLSCATRPIMQQELTSTFLNVFTYSTEASVLKFGELSNWVIFSRRIKYILTNFFNVTKNNWTSIVSDYIWYVSKILFFFLTDSNCNCISIFVFSCLVESTTCSIGTAVPDFWMKDLIKVNLDGFCEVPAKDNHRFCCCLPACPTCCEMEHNP